MPNILLAVSGSVATIKLPELYARLRERGDVKIVATGSASKFIDTLSPAQRLEVITDADEWSSWKAVGDDVVHIELRRWADVLVIAPLSANTLAKLALGLSDNLLTCIVRAWDWQHDPVVLAPAMNTLMWDNPFTHEHIDRIRELGAVVIPPVAKKLACGDVGVGAMASPQAIAEVVDIVLQNTSTSATSVADSGAGHKGSNKAGRPLLPHGAMWGGKALTSRPRLLGTGAWLGAGVAVLSCAGVVLTRLKR